MRRLCGACLLLLIALRLTLTGSEIVETPLREVSTNPPKSAAPVAYETSVESPAESITIPTESRGRLVVIPALDQKSSTEIELSLTEQGTSPISWTRIPTFQPRKLTSTPMRLHETRFTEVNDSVERAFKSRNFWLHVTEGPLNEARNYTQISAPLLAESEHVRIYLDDQRSITPRLEKLAAEILHIFEQHLLPAATAQFGLWRDVDADGKLTILLTPWLGKLQGGKTSLKGFVRGCDFFNVPPPFGNEGDILYLNSELSPTEHLPTLLAHEFFHVLQFSIRGMASGLPIEHDWLSEGQAHLAENLFGGNQSNLAHRIDAFLLQPESSPLLVENYYEAGLWRDDGCRGATFLFLRWCLDQYGENILTELLHAPLSGCANLELVTGEPIERLHREWVLAMLTEARTNAPYRFDWQKSGFPQPDFSRLNQTRLDDTHQRVNLTLQPSTFGVIRIDSPRNTSVRIKSNQTAGLKVIWIPDMDQ